MPAHPRVCGENRRLRRREPLRRGSSPRVRGKLHRVAQAHQRRGLIPACAGKTVSAVKRAGAVAAHPCVCGENGGGAHGLLRRRGSSPRVRGKHAADTHPGVRAGLIPACAGKTVGVGVERHGPWAHPRVCGENSLTASAASWIAGSSPRVRGKLNSGFECLEPGRLIPACAGKTGVCGRGDAVSPAHPRVCGENRRVLEPTLTMTGSSPRVRGKRARRRWRR